MLSPWNDPTPFTRAWCLFEIYCSIGTGSKLDVAMSGRDMKEFQETIRTDTGAYFNMLGKIDVRKSEAFNAEDRRQIFETVEGSVGFQSVNGQVMEKMREWVIGRAEGAAGLKGGEGWEEEVRDKMARANL